MKEWAQEMKAVTSSCAGGAQKGEGTREGGLVSTAIRTSGLKKEAPKMAPACEANPSTVKQAGTENAESLTSKEIECRHGPSGRWQQALSRWRKSPHAKGGESAGDGAIGVAIVRLRVSRRRKDRGRSSQLTPRVLDRIR